MPFAEELRLRDRKRAEGRAAGKKKRSITLQVGGNKKMILGSMIIRRQLHKMALKLIFFRFTRDVFIEKGVVGASDYYSGESNDGGKMAV